MGRLWAMLTGAGMPSPAGRGRRAERELQLAAAALLIEAATVDRNFDAAERERILLYARSRFGLDEAEAEALIEAAERNAAGSTQIFRFTQIVKNGLSYEERVRLVESLWEVVYADGHADPYEKQLMRRIAGLIYVTDRDSGQARRRALERLESQRRPKGRGGSAA